MALPSSVEPCIPSSSTMDLQTAAVRLCIALQSESNSAFLDAANDLLSCIHLSPCGIPQPQSQDRMKSLLVRLSSNFTGPNSRVDTHIAFPPDTLDRLGPGTYSKRVPQPSITPCAGAGVANSASISMPPPDAFPPGTRKPKWSRYQRKRPRRHLLLLPSPSPSPPRMHKRVRRRMQGGEFDDEDSEQGQENQVPGPIRAPAPERAQSYSFKPPRLTKRFGIFCTGKSSMHRPWSAVKAC
ncbi:hypothetical protein FB45DRAFT_1011365 [Roridomyces roridus]|uniref:Uncharacterized protein n=1 Tax=Roridomyces roridus TaxID=1738132 RepID=A0AAD7B0U0_9AGAR|nr:hypothetical protein FB45DRAFT_1011365 [Roridomyces roridus]